MTVDLPPELARYVKSMIQSGKYASADEVVSHALQVFRDVEKSFSRSDDDLRQLIQEGLDDVKAGRVSEWNVEEMKDRLRQKLKRRKAS